MKRYVIVGGGIAGLSAAEALREHDPGGEITLVGAEPHPFYSRPGLAYLLAGAIPERQLAIREPGELRDLALERIFAEAVRIDLGARDVILAGGRRVRWDRLLLCTGSAAVAPDLPGADLDGVVTLDGLDDARAILARARRTREAVVVGGGPTAIELAEGLRARGLRVHYLLRGGRYWSAILDPVESHIIEDGLRAAGIAVHPHARVERAVGADGRLTAVEVAGLGRLPCDLLAVAVGVRPRVELARAAGLAVERGVVVDGELRTSAPDVFAAGDVAEARDPETGAGRLDVLWSSAREQGRVAGMAMAGAAPEWRRRPSLNVTRLGGVTIAIAGSVGPGAGAGDEDDLITIARGDSEWWRAVAGAETLHAGRERATRVRAVLGARAVVGAVVLGDAAASRALVRLVRDRVDLGALRPALERRGADAVQRLIELGDRAGGADARGA